MRLVVLMAMQAAVAGPPLPAELKPAKPAAPSTPCGETDGRGEIIVCGRAKDAYRLPRIDQDRYAERPVRAETGIGRARVGVEAEQGTLPNGQSSPRAMLRLKLPF